MVALLERYADRIRGILSCFDRVVLTGTLPEICHAAAMASYLTARGIRLFDYPQWAQPYREKIRENAEAIAKQSGLEIEFIVRKNFRKEDRIAGRIAERGDHPGMIHIFSAMEPCTSFRPWHDKLRGKTYFKTTRSKCLHYYFYFIDEELGLCYVRVPTWAPFRLQIYFNGHDWLSRQLDKKRMRYTLVDNAFTDIEDFPRAQKIADAFPVKRLHRRLDRFALRFCPILRDFRVDYHWSIMQVEYATDIIFKTQQGLSSIYEGLIRTAIHAVKVDHIATFLGHKVDGRFSGELGTDFQTRILGTRIKHFLREVAIKMYDKFGLVLRIETTSNNVSFFRHHRKVEHRDGTSEFKVAPLRKSIYSLPVLLRLMKASNRRYLEFISELDHSSAGARHLTKIAETVRQKDRTYRGFNVLSATDLRLFLALVRGEFGIHGFTNRMLRALLPGLSGAQISRILKRLRVHGLIRKVNRTYTYHLTKRGQQISIAALEIRERVILPRLAQAA
jgi:hypothetical protein